MMLPRLLIATMIALACSAPSLAQGNSANAPGQSNGNNGNSRDGASPGNSGNAPGLGSDAPGQAGDTLGHGGTLPGQGSSPPGQSGSAPVQGGGPPVQDGPRTGQRDGLPGPHSSGTPVPNGNALPSSQPTRAAPPGTAANPVPLSADQVRSAVEARQVLPLSGLTELIGERGGGEIVDASLLRVDGMLVYAVKVLAPGGRLSVQYYHARSGVYIGSQ